MAQETGGLKTQDTIDKEILDAAGGADELEHIRDEEESDGDEETERIRQQIDETRSDMSETIDAIQERLSISNISEQVTEQVSNALETAKDTVYDATFGKVVTFMKQARDGMMQTSAGRTVMNNPLPFALIGAGAALLVYNNWGKSGMRQRRMADYRTKPYLTSEGRASGGQEIGETISGAAGSITEKASHAVETLSHTASGAIESVTNAAGNTLESAKGVANRAYERAAELGTTAQEKYEHYVDERPLAVAAAAAAVGAAIGFAIPATRYEGQLVGETRDNLLDRAGETASQLVDRAKDVASEAGKTISQELKGSGEISGGPTNPRPNF